MSERDALLAAILANPYDDTVRLAFADWCDENGEADRAEFIRMQIQFANSLEPGSEADTLARFVPAYDWYILGRLSPELAHRASLQKRGNELLDTNRTHWLGRQESESVKFWFARGFPDSAQIVQLEAYHAWQEMIRSFPVTGLSVGGWFNDACEFGQVLRSGILARLTGLRLYAERSELLVWLGESSQVGGIRSLSLACDASNLFPVVQAFAAGRGWQKIECLDIGFTQELVRFPANIIELIASTPHLQHIGELTLEGVLDIDAVEALVRACPQLESLTIRDMTPSAASRLAQTDLPELQALHIVPRSDSSLTAEAIAALLITPRFPKLAACRVGGHVTQDLSGLGLHLTGACREPTLRHLELRHSGLAPDDAVALARCPALRGLIFLKLGGNAIGSVGASALANADWPRLASLELSSCYIDESGAMDLAAGGLPELQQLNLRSNPIGPAGCKAFARSDFPRLQFLELVTCCADYEAKAELRQRFGDRVRV
jgi:uncharacterized protein (TIGR02996 family)